MPGAQVHVVILDAGEEAFATHWDTVTRPGGPLEHVPDFPYFPNPHIRTNGFLVNRHAFLEQTAALEALLAGLAYLSPRQRELIVLMTQDPPPTYAEISERTGIPIGAIGPTRVRALARLRESPALRALATGVLDTSEVSQEGRGPR